MKLFLIQEEGNDTHWIVLAPDLASAKEEIVKQSYAEESDYRVRGFIERLDVNREYDYYDRTDKIEILGRTRNEDRYVKALVLAQAATGYPEFSVDLKQRGGRS
jgi:hypothetical protein